MLIPRFFTPIIFVVYSSCKNRIWATALRKKADCAVSHVCPPLSEGYRQADMLVQLVRMKLEATRAMVVRGAVAVNGAEAGLRLRRRASGETSSNPRSPRFIGLHMATYNGQFLRDLMIASGISYAGGAQNIYVA